MNSYLHVFIMDNFICFDEFMNFLPQMMSPVLSFSVLSCLVLYCIMLCCPISSSLLFFTVWFFSHRLLLNWIANSMHLLMDRRQQERRQLQRMVKVASNQLFDIIQCRNRSRVSVFWSRLRHWRFTICVMRAGRKMRMTK